MMWIGGHGPHSGVLAPCIMGSVFMSCIVGTGEIKEGLRYHAERFRSVGINHYAVTNTDVVGSIH